MRAIILIVEIRGDISPLPRQANGGAPEIRRSTSISRLPQGDRTQLDESVIAASGKFRPDINGRDRAE